MRKILALDHHLLEKGNVIAVDGSIEVVTNVLDHTFYSAPIFKDSGYKDEPLRKASHWVSEFNDFDEIKIFTGIVEAMSYMKEEYERLAQFYNV